MQTLQQLHINCGRIFNNKIFVYGDGKTKACEIYFKMISDPKLDNNCLGENFNQMLEIIKSDFFNKYKPSQDTEDQFYFTSFIMWLYFVTSRVDFIFDLLNSSNDQSSIFRVFQNKYLSSFQLIRRWANFFKHPREFIFCHWPEFHLENDFNRDEINSSVIIIDSEFVKDNYSRKNGPIKSLNNAMDVVVLIPDLEKLTLTFCNEINSFFDFILENKVVFELLKEKTTIEGYYEGRIIEE
jgi:hypothetical protein